MQIDRRGRSASSLRSDRRPILAVSQLTEAGSMRVQLTKRLIDTYQAQDRPYEVRDAQVRGLILRVQPSGHKAWIVSWAHGKRRTIGPTAAVPLDMARAQATHAVAEYLQSGLPRIEQGRSTAMTLRELIDLRYRAWATLELKRGQMYANRLEQVFAAHLDDPLNGFSTGWAEQWWQHRLSTPTDKTQSPPARSTVARDLACLRAALSKAVSWGLMPSNPLMGMRMRGSQSRMVVRYLSMDEEARLRAVMAARDRNMIAARVSGNRWRALRQQDLYPEIPADTYGDHLTPVVLLALNTGMRRGELLSMTWADIDLEAKMLTIRAESAKSGRQRHVPLNIEALDALQRWSARNGGRQIGRVFNVNDVKTGWVRLLADARIEQFRFHDLRHHFASRLVRASVDLNTVRELLGHADIKMTLRYAHLAPDTLAAAVAKLAA